MVTIPDDLVILDFETRSHCPLREEGLGRYCRHDSTEVLCMGYIPPGEVAPQLWLPGQPAPDFSNVTVAAFNVAFEKSIWEYVLKWPAPQGWFDIAAHARFCGLPGKLADTCKFLGLAKEISKSDEGHKVMLRLSSPIKTGKLKGQWDNDPALYKQLYEYVLRDCIAEQAVLLRLPEWPAIEREIFSMTLNQNERGCPIDVALCEAVVSLTEQYVDKATATIQEATSGAIVSPQQTVALTRWLNERKVNVDNVRKETVETLLAQTDLDPVIVSVLKARQIGAPASLKKFKAALNKQVGGRLYHNFIYSGGGATGRWSGGSDDSSAVQLQNLKRGSQTEEMLNIIKLADAEILSAVCDNPIKELQNSTRSMLRASDGNAFLYTDLAGIEARTLRWLARSPSLEDFRKFDLGGPDPYRAEAAKTFNKPIDDVTGDERQCGKVLVLSGQYGCGWEKLQATVALWSGGAVVLSDGFAQAAIQSFRRMNPEIVRFWKALERAFKAVLSGDKEKCAAGCLMFESPSKGIVTMKLPSGRKVYYNRCKFLDGEIVYTKHDGMLVKYYGGHGSENAASGIARDLMALDMLQCEKFGIYIVHHAHDGLLAETPTPVPDGMLEMLSKIMTTPPVWAPGLPLAAPVKIVTRMP